MFVKILLDLKKTVHENAALYFEEAKKWKKKATGARAAIAQVEGRSMAKASDRMQAVPEATGKVRKVKTGWFGEYQHAYTKNGFLVVCGKNAKQNDQLVSRHLKEGDLFFHADIVGASATLLKGAGKKPAREDLDQAAQLAAVYSRAWKQGYHSVDVYAVEPKQVTKYSQGEYVGQGAFIISGERLWFRNTELKLYVRGDAASKSASIAPVAHGGKPDGAVLLQPGDVKKEDASKQLARKFKVREEALLSVLPGDIQAF